MEKKLPPKFWKNMYGKLLEKIILGGLGLICMWTIAEVFSLRDYNIETKKDNQMLRESVSELKDSIKTLNSSVAKKSDLTRFENSLSAQWRVLAELEKGNTDVEVRLRILEIMKSKKSQDSAIDSMNCREALDKLKESLQQLKKLYDDKNMPHYVLDAENALNRLVERLGEMKEEHRIEKFLKGKEELDYKSYRLRKERQQNQ